MAKQCVIVDLDGTLCDTSNRVHHAKAKNWDAFHADCVNDQPHWYLVELIRTLAMSTPIILCSGRPDNFRKQTMNWLENNGIWCWAQLYMRKNGDWRPDTVIKREILDKIRSKGYEPLVAIDDRPSVVQMWRDNGVPCLAAHDASWDDDRVKESTKYVFDKWRDPNHLQLHGGKMTAQEKRTVIAVLNAVEKEINGG